MSSNKKIKVTGEGRIFNEKWTVVSGILFYRNEKWSIMPNL